MYVLLYMCIYTYTWGNKITEIKLAFLNFRIY